LLRPPQFLSRIKLFFDLLRPPQFPVADQARRARPAAAAPSLQRGDPSTIAAAEPARSRLVEPARRGLAVPALRRELRCARPQLLRLDAPARCGLAAPALHPARPSLPAAVSPGSVVGGAQLWTGISPRRTLAICGPTRQVRAGRFRWRLAMGGSVGSCACRRRIVSSLAGAANRRV
jgi:hypothetical protein